MDNQCGVTSYSGNFRFSVDQIFNVTYWPYTQDPNTYKCIRRFFVDSYDSLILQFAKDRYSLYTINMFIISLILYIKI